MKHYPFTLHSISLRFIGVALLWVTLSNNLQAQITPPGYEREIKMIEERQRMPALDRDSIMLIDTAVIFNPETYESETIITKTTYSLRDYCIQFLGVQNPDILLDNKPHTIIDPRTYEDLIIRLNPAGKIDTIAN